MAHKSTLKIDRKEYNVIECEYEFVKPIKENGQPAGKSSGGLIHLTIVSPDNNDMFLYDWMQSATEHKDGQVVFRTSCFYRSGNGKPNNENATL